MKSPGPTTYDPRSFAPLRVLKRTAQSETLLVRGESGEQCVVKTISAGYDPVSGWGHRAGKLEIRPQRDCPGVEKPLDVRIVGNAVQVVRSYVPGVTLRESLDLGPLDLDGAIDLGRSILTSLSCLHGQKVVHFDIRPENVILDPHRGLEEVTVVDIAADVLPFEALVRGDESARSLRYTAPERAGIIHRSADARADLYSLGVMLFECLAGRPPFDADQTRELLRQHVSAPMPGLRAAGVRVPQAFEAILQRLSHKDPEDRYRSADAALADLIDLEQALASGVPEPEIAVGSHDWRQSLTEPALIGREAELNALHRGLNDAGAGAGRLIVLEAESGGGKSRVLDEFCRRIEADGAWVLRGQGIELAAKHPLQILEGLVDAVIAAPDQAPRITDELGDSVGPLSRALPKLSAVLPESTESALSPRETEARVRTVAALVGLLDSLGTADRPAAVVLDDCQWIDELTLQVLRAWFDRVRRDPGEPVHVLVVLSIRREDDGNPALTEDLGSAEWVRLPGLDSEQVRRVVRSMAGMVPSEAISTIETLSGGNAFMVSAVLRGLVESGTLRTGAGGWEYTPDPDGWQASREAAAVLAQRIALLTPATRRLLAAGAVLGRTFDLRLAASLVGEPGCPVDATLTIGQAVERHLIWQDDGGLCSFVHDRLRETLLADLPARYIAGLHHKAAVAIETSDPSRAFDLAYHFDAAGEQDRAVGYAMQSAAAARARHDLELAERLYRIAERGASDEAAPRLEIAESLGQILMLRGRYAEAAERFDRALTLATADTDTARLEGQLGEVLFRFDDLDGSVQHSEAGLRVLGERVPRSTTVIVFALLYEMLRWCVLRRGADRRAAATERQLLRSRLYTQLQYPRWFHSRRISAMWLMLRQLNVAERSPNNPELAHSYGVWGGSISLTLPMLARYGRGYAERSLALSHAQGDLRGEGHASSMLACALLGSADYEGAVEAARIAALNLEQNGDRWEVNFASRNHALGLYRAGRYAEALDEARQVHRLGIEIGDVNAEVTALEIIAKVSGGQVSSAHTQRALRLRGSDIEVVVGAAQAEALRMRAGGRLRDAEHLLVETTRYMRFAWPSSVYLVPVYSWLATVRREIAESCQLPGQRKHALRRAVRASRRAVICAFIYPGERPHAFREAGIVAALRGRSRRTRRLIRWSAAAAERQKAWAEYAELRRQCARLGLAVPAGPTREMEVAPTESEEEERPSTLGLADRFESLLEAGAVLAAADSPGAIAAAVRQTTTSLLRTDRCCAVGLGDDDNRWPGLGTADYRAVHAVAETIEQQTRPVSLSEPYDTAHDIDDTLALAGIRSVIGAPVLVQGEMVGCIVAAHYQVGQLFGDEEVRLVEFIARLAGAALERQNLRRQTRIRVVNAQEAERARIARDLHDEIGQAFTSMLLQVRSIADCANEAKGELRSALLPRTAELRDTVNEGLRTAQRLAFDLRPAVLDDLGLVAALRRLVTDTPGNRSVTMKLETVELNNVDRLPTTVETTAYRVVQEGLTNVIRHSGATECSVVVARQGNRLRVLIEDDGSGFDTDHSHAGLGVRGMIERAELAGGSLSITSAPGQGTEIVLEIPIV